MRTSRLVPAALAAALLAGGAAAQSTGSGSSGSSVTGGRSAPAAQSNAGDTRPGAGGPEDKVARSDRKFIETAAGGGMFEVEAAKLAQGKARSPDVKNFAGMLVDHHTQANDELIRMANAKGVELAPGPPRGQRRELEALGRKEGQEFDRDFIREVGIKAHQKDIKEFEKARKDAKDPQLKAWVDKTLPRLREHLAAAQKLDKSGAANDAAGMGGPGTHNGASTRTGGGSGANRTGS